MIEEVDISSQEHRWSGKFTEMRVQKRAFLNKKNTHTLCVTHTRVTGVRVCALERDDARVADAEFPR